MCHLTTSHEIGGKQGFKHFDAPNKQQAMNRARKHYGTQKWEIYACKKKVKACATSSEVGQSLKVL